jgi:hypothetical protein
MPRILTILLVTMLFAGCCTTSGYFCKGSLPSDVCATGTISGYTLTGIAYGDSSLIVVPISHIRRDTEWRFRLQPIKLDSDYEDYEDAIVTIEGKTAEGTQPADHNAWIAASGSYRSTAAEEHTLAVCVPDDAPKGTIFKYSVNVDLIGTIDPRGDVE